VSWLDISQPLEPGMVVWPGDEAFQSQLSASMRDGDPYNLGSIRLSLHAGTHADAPRHFERDGADIGDCRLDVFIGPALVLDVSGARAVARAAFEPLSDFPERILLKTGTGVEAGWHEDFAYLHEDAAAELVRRGVRLVGVDTPSVDEAHSAAWPVHRRLAASGVVVLENLRLAGVAPGWYELVALPLRLRGLEASPVRAALRPLSPPRLPGATE
jgi:arylformamidase